jgi:hypothetical protein
MKIRMFDSLGEDDARQLTGCKVIDESGESFGTVDGLWMDSSTRRVEFVGVKSTWSFGKVHVLPAGDAEILEESNLIRIRYPATLIKEAPTFSPREELAQVEKEEINGHCGRSVAARRRTSIEEIRPEEAKSDPVSEEDSKPLGSGPVGHDRDNLERREQAFFNQEGFVTDSVSEVNASEELLRTEKEAKARNREDRIKSGSLD